MKMENKVDVLSAEKTADLSVCLRADSGYECTISDIRISVQQWCEINEILFRKEEKDG